MEKKTFVKFAGAALILGTLASCNEELELIAENSKDAEAREAYQMAVTNYNAHFEESFGKIDPANNWGFDPIPFINLDATRGANANSNEWAPMYHFEVPGGQEADNSKPWGWSHGDITQYERAYVYWWFSTHQWPSTLTVDWRFFFVENVWGQPEHSGLYADGSNSTTEYNPRFGMDYMELLKMDQEAPAYSPSKAYINESNAMDCYFRNADSEKYEHINDFNSGGGAKEQVMYMFDVSTADFGYQASFPDINPKHNNWTIQYINGEYYLGFDYWHKKSNNDDYNTVEADGYYNDWIIKLSSGQHKIDEYTRRIMCEDLGNSFDWDFNDVVFDVTAVEKNGQKLAMITIQAVGGTLPIYIGDDPRATGTLTRELHSLFGVPVTTPVNVYAPSGVQRPAVVFMLECKDEWLENGKLQAEKIPVWVEHVTGQAINADANTSYFRLTAEKSNAPHKIACPSNTYWMRELKNISETNDLFMDWVNGNYANFPSCTEGELYAEKDRWCITDTHRKEKFNANVHYADNGKPYANAHSQNTGQTSAVRPWKDLWEECDKNATAYTQDYTYVKKGAETYTRNFKDQAPYIYCHKSQLDNGGDQGTTLSYTTALMPQVLTYFEEQGDPLVLVWPSGAKTLTVNVLGGQGGQVAGGGQYYVGRSASIKAVPAPGFLFDHWTDGNTSAERSVVISDNDAENSYTAVFKKGTLVSVDLPENISLGVLLNNMGNGPWTVEQGSQCTLTINVYYRANNGELALTLNGENCTLTQQNGVYEYAFTATGEEMIFKLEYNTQE